MESISALMDGELDSDEAAREIARVKQDTARRDNWAAYHAIGDAMRGTRALSPDFSQCLSEKLALEPTVVAPRPRSPRTVQSYALAAAASVAAVAAVGWMWTNMLNPDVVPATVAQAPAIKPPAVAALQPPSVLPRTAPAMAPEHVHEYLLAHQGISPSTAIQGVTSYIRTVSNVGDEPGLR